jgi:hypothetical protein
MLVGMAFWTKSVAAGVIFALAAPLPSLSYAANPKHAEATAGFREQALIPGLLRFERTSFEPRKTQRVTRLTPKIPRRRLLQGGAAATALLAFATRLAAQPFAAHQVAQPHVADLVSVNAGRRRAAADALAALAEKDDTLRQDLIAFLIYEPARHAADRALQTLLVTLRSRLIAQPGARRSLWQIVKEGSSLEESAAALQFLVELYGVAGLAQTKADEPLLTDIDAALDALASARTRKGAAALLEKLGDEPSRGRDVVVRRLIYRQALAEAVEDRETSDAIEPLLKSLADGPTLMKILDTQLDSRFLPLVVRLLPQAKGITAESVTEKALETLLSQPENVALEGPIVEVLQILPVDSREKIAAVISYGIRVRWIAEALGQNSRAAQARTLISRYAALSAGPAALSYLVVTKSDKSMRRALLEEMDKLPRETLMKLPALKDYLLAMASDPDLSELSDKLFDETYMTPTEIEARKKALAAARTATERLQGERDMARKEALLWADEVPEGQQEGKISPNLRPTLGWLLAEETDERVLRGVIRWLSVRGEYVPTTIDYKAAKRLWAMRSDTKFSSHAWQLLARTYRPFEMGVEVTARGLQLRMGQNPRDRGEERRDGLDLAYLVNIFADPNRDPAVRFEALRQISRNDLKRQEAALLQRPEALREIVREIGSAVIGDAAERIILQPADNRLFGLFLRTDDADQGHFNRIVGELLVTRRPDVFKRRGYAKHLMAVLSAANDERKAQAAMLLAQSPDLLESILPARAGQPLVSLLKNEQLRTYAGQALAGMQKNSAPQAAAFQAFILGRLAAEEAGQPELVKIFEGFLAQARRRIGAIEALRYLSLRGLDPRVLAEVRRLQAPAAATNPQLQAAA